MKILHINTFDFRGGAGRALFRLNIGLQHLGVESRLLVRTKNSEFKNVKSISNAHSQKLEFFFRSISRHSSFQDLYFPSTYHLAKNQWFQAADLINLHNIHGHYFAYPALLHLSKMRPIIWTLHDMWGFTGHCSYSFDCQGWKTGCGNCPHLKIYPALNIDTSAILWRLKKSVFRQSKLTLVTPSLWLAELVKQSPILGHLPVHCIPNSVDTDIYYPLDKHAARAHLKLPDSAFIILFMAEKLNNFRKGSDLLLAALNRLSNQLPSQDIYLITFGQGGETWRDKIPYPLYNFGSMDNDREIASCYSAADIFILPSRQDNLPNGLLECQACGTPCVAFDVGGVSEVISHMHTGYLATPESIPELVEGIEFYLKNIHFFRESRISCRMNAETNYRLEVQARRYLELYSSQIKIESRRRDSQ